MAPVNFHIFILSTTQYRDSLPNLQGVKNSVEELKEALNMQSVDVEWCHDMSHVDALEKLQAYIGNISNVANGGKESSEKEPKSSQDFFLFYFCGHGFIGRSQNLMFGTTDTSNKNYSYVGIPCDVVVEEIKQAGIKNFILILDCCHSGTVTDMGHERFEEKVDSILEKLSEGGGVYVTSTSKSIQTAKEIELDGTKYAAFTHYFAQALRKGIGNAKSYVSLASLIGETKKLMQASPYKELLPPPKIKCTNSYDSVEIFRNPATPLSDSASHPEDDQLKKAMDAVREEIIPAQSRDSDLIFALVGTFGTELDKISAQLKNTLTDYGYMTVEEISISKSILQNADNQRHFLPKAKFYASQECEGKSAAYKWARYLMELGSKMRHLMGNDILAMGAVDIIARRRREAKTAKPKGDSPLRHAYIIRSLKHPDEVKLLRDVYGNGFYLFGIYEDAEQRRRNTEENISKNEAEALMSTDEKEGYEHGQKARDTYQMADFFINYTDPERGNVDIKRILDLIFGNPFITPTFSEYAMFMAWCASLRSADLSRQIGAVVCKNNEVLVSGANDCPATGGGLYWPKYDSKKKRYVDVPDGRDYMRGRDTNKAEFVNIVKELSGIFGRQITRNKFREIKNSMLGNLTEYGRVVHAEMEAIAACARNHISCRDAELYVTTFPCHNCAKHIIASGFRKVVYIEAYPKSKTFDFYKESITSKDEDELQEKKESGASKNEPETKKVIFAPFFGVGPRRFVDVFAMNANLLPDKKRKRSEKEDDDNNFLDNYGKKQDWDASSACLRFQMPSKTHIDREIEYAKYYLDLRQAYAENSGIAWEEDSS